MHVADGILPVSLCIAGYAVSLAGCAAGGRKLESDEVPRMGLLAAASFVASTVHVPIAGASVHFGMFGLLGLMLGLRALPVIFAVLLLQTFLFQHGGFLTLGVNATNMGAGAICGMLVGQVRSLPFALRTFMAGLLGILVPAVMVLAEFQLAGYGRSLLLLAAVYALLGAMEGLFTAMVAVFLQRIRPAMLATLAPAPVLGSMGPARDLERPVL